MKIIEKIKLGFEEFIEVVDNDNKEYISELHHDFITHNCNISVKESKSSYMVSYTVNKKVVANFVFRKTGLIIRLYANHINKYMDVLETLPDAMVKTIQNSSICKRLINPDTCNLKCAMGYDFLLRGEHLQKCRSNAFMFLLCKENNPYIKLLLKNELNFLDK